MRKLLFWALALLVLSGCGAPVPETPEPPPEEPPAEEAFSLPETWRLEPLSAPGIVTEGREPVTPVGDRNDLGNMMRWVYENTAELLAETPGAYFYALPRTEEHPETALIRWGGERGGVRLVLFHAPYVFAGDALP